MIDQITAHHKSEYGIAPTVICSAPGKIDLLGKHGEFGQGYLLSFAVDRRLYVAMSKRKDNALHFYSANLGEHKKTTINGLRYKKEDRWANYSKGVVHELLRMGFRFKGVSITIFSDVPMGIGLASSVAMTVATGCAMKYLFKFEMSDGQIIEAARSAESHFMGLYLGICSPLASFSARKNHLSLIDIRSLEVKYFRFPPSPMGIVITDSRVTEVMSDEEKKKIDEACQECLTVLDISKSGDLFRNLKREDLASTIEGLSERSRRISLHFVTENTRIQEFCKAIEENLPKVAGRILSRSHESLRDNLEISCPELDWLAKRGTETDGVYGSRMIGPGYGGCTITLMDDAARSRHEEYLEEYDRIFGFNASVFSVKVGSGLHLHLSDTVG